MRLEAAVLLLASAVLVLAGVIGWYVVRGVPVHYIPPGGPGLSQPGSIPDAVALDFAGPLAGAALYVSPGDAHRGAPGRGGDGASTARAAITNAARARSHLD